jgi:hypothetical protein
MRLAMVSSVWFGCSPDRWVTKITGDIGNTFRGMEDGSCPGKRLLQ